MSMFGIITKREEKAFKPLQLCGPISMEAAKGKTVAAMFMEASHLIIKFDDETFLVASAEAEDADLEIVEARWWVCDSIRGIMPQSLLRAGAISKEQFDSWAQEKELKRLAQQNENDRKTFERLQKKFGEQTK